MRPGSVRSFLFLLTAYLSVTTTAAQLRVFRGTIVHSRVRTEMEVLQDHLIGFDEDNMGSIVFLQPANELESLAQLWNFNQNDVVTLTNSQFLMPGLVDTHFHAHQYYRGGTDRQSEFDYVINTFVASDLMFRNATYAREVSRVAVRHTLQFGTTTVGYYSATSINGNIELAKVVDELGQRATIHQLSIDTLPATFMGVLPPGFEQTTEEALNSSRRFIEFIEELENPLIRASIGHECSETVTPELLEALGMLANSTDALVQIRFALGIPELNTTLPDWVEAGIIPVNRTMLIYSVPISEADMETYRRRGISVAHCPSSILNNGIILDVRRMLNLGITVGLGTDNGLGFTHSVLTEMREALLASRAILMSLPMSNRLTLAEGFYMATMGGAEALRLGDTVGNFEVGKQFDALLIDTSVPSPFDTGPNDNMDDRTEKFLFFGDDRNILRVYVAGKLRSSRDGLSRDLPLRISHVNDSPRIVGSSVSVDVSVNKPTQSLTCHLRGVSGVGREFSDQQDCSSLNIVYPNLNAGKYVLRVVGNAVTGEKDVMRRDFQIGGSGDCTVNLINRGIMVRGNMVTIWFAVNGDAASHTCRIDRQQIRRCQSPVTYSGLSSGEHSFQVSPQGCTAGSSYKLSAKFTVP